MPAEGTHGRRRQPGPLALARGTVLPIGERTLIMGVVNVTPDSFYRQSRAPQTDDAVERALAMAAEGADIVDIGGESTRPGAAAVPEAEEMERVLPVVEQLRKRSPVAVSIDTRRASVAGAALAAGADIVNDVSGGTADPAMTAVIAGRGAVALIMHMRGTPQTMGEHARYEDIVLQVKAELGARVAAAARAGIAESRIWIDPGLGFAKTPRHCLELLRRLEELQVFEKTIVVGASRKSFLGRILGTDDPAERLEASLAVAAVSVYKGAHVLRVHDVAATRRAAVVAEAIREPARGPE